MEISPHHLQITARWWLWLGQEDLSWSSSAGEQKRQATCTDTEGITGHGKKETNAQWRAWNILY
jgi:hypothetical protein